MTTKGAQHWLGKAHLDGLSSPVLFSGVAQVSGHRFASVMRQGFDVIGVNAFFCVDGVPVVAFTHSKLAHEVIEIYKALWNQGAVSMLISIDGNELDIYSLHKVPDGGSIHSSLVDTLDLTIDALAARNFLTSVESGRCFVEHQNKFDKKGKVDRVLLDNLAATEEKLIHLGMSMEPARALVIQTVFIAYLEDRGLITSDFISRTLSCENDEGYLGLLKARDPARIKDLFAELHRRFNGNVFYSPSAFGNQDISEELTSEQLDCLADFRGGSVHVGSGQQYLWPYDFRFIQVELISAIYDRLLSKVDERKKLGAFFTPHYLADFTVDQVLEASGSNILLDSNSKICDASCGSGVFLVSFFKRAVEAYRVAHGQPGWHELVDIAERLHGVDPQSSAVRLAVFSLYIAMIEEAGERLKEEIEDYIPLFPRLYGESIKTGDFFDLDESLKFSCILGNPPWASRGNSIASAEKWAKENHMPTPQQEAAWAFVWKCLRHIEPGGHASLLLPAMGFLHNHSPTTLIAQKKLFSEVSIKRIYDFSDISFQLFEGAKRPTALIIMQPIENKDEPSSRHIEYLCPKVSRIFSANVITVEKSDVHSVSGAQASSGRIVWKELLWGTSRERKLLGWLKDLPSLSSFVTSYKSSKKGAVNHSGGEGILGQGFKPAVLENIKSDPTYSWSEHADINEIPFFDAKEFSPFVVDVSSLGKRDDPRFHSAGFKQGFFGPRILIPQGIERKEQFLRAAYTEKDFSFNSSLQAIKFPAGNEDKAKLITAYLNSSLAAWFLFHTTSYWGVDRAKVTLTQMLNLPFPDPKDCRNSDLANTAKEELVKLFNTLQADGSILKSQNHTQKIRMKADQLIYQYFGLVESEITVIEDTVKYVMPSIQPRHGKTTVLRKPATSDIMMEYVNTLSDQLNNWLKGGKHLQTTIYTGSQDFVVAEFSLSQSESNCSIESVDYEAIQKLNVIRDQIVRQQGELLGYVSEVRVWVEDKLYFIKPNEIRHWMRSAALNDADMIAASVIQSHQRKES